MKAQITNDIKTAMKSRNAAKRDILRVLIGEIERHEQGKHGKIVLSNDEITSIIKKMVTNIKETEGNFTIEAEILTEYLPKMLAEDVMDEIIRLAIEIHKIDSMRGMAIIMREFSTYYPNRYDGKVVSGKIRKLLS